MHPAAGVGPAAGVFLPPCHAAAAEAGSCAVVAAIEEGPVLHPRLGVADLKAQGDKACLALPVESEHVIATDGGHGHDDCQSDHDVDAMPVVSV